jgi:hypothetical protein
MTKSHRWRVLKRGTYLNVAISPDGLGSGVPVFQIDEKHRTWSSGNDIIPFNELGSNYSGTRMAFSGPCGINQAGFCER